MQLFCIYFIGHFSPGDQERYGGIRTKYILNVTKILARQQEVRRDRDKCIEYFERDVYYHHGWRTNEIKFQYFPTQINIFPP